MKAKDRRFPQNRKYDRKGAVDKASIRAASTLLDRLMSFLVPQELYNKHGYLAYYTPNTTDSEVEAKLKESVGTHGYVLSAAEAADEQMEWERLKVAYEQKGLGKPKEFNVYRCPMEQHPKSFMETEESILQSVRLSPLSLYDRCTMVFLYKAVLRGDLVFIKELSKALGASVTQTTRTHMVRARVLAKYPDLKPWKEVAALLPTIQQVYPIGSDQRDDTKRIIVACIFELAQHKLISVPFKDRPEKSDWELVFRILSQLAGSQNQATALRGFISKKDNKLDQFLKAILSSDFEPLNALIGLAPEDKKIKKRYFRDVGNFRGEFYKYFVPKTSAVKSRSSQKSLKTKT